MARYRQARSFFEDAIASDDGLTLARVRLGRVQWRLGEREAGQAALEKAVERSADPQLSYLAHLFLGRVHEDSGRLPAQVGPHQRRPLRDRRGQDVVAIEAGVRGRGCRLLGAWLVIQQ